MTDICSRFFYVEMSKNICVNIEKNLPVLKIGTFVVLYSDFKKSENLNDNIPHFHGRSCELVRIPSSERLFKPNSQRYSD